MELNLTTLLYLGTFIMTIVTTSWRLHTEISQIKISLEKLLTKFETVDRLEKRVDRLEKKVFDLEDTSPDHL